jgi:FkbM family methyltransferase
MVRARHGYVLYNKNDTEVGKFVGHFGEYFETEAIVFRQVCAPGQIVVDAGANIGTHTLALAEIVGPSGRVYAFEPQHNVHQYLCANVALNSLGNVQCIRAALADRDGEILLRDAQPEAPANFAALSLAQLAGSIRTPMVTLDTYLNVPHLRLVKIDVEGMELDVLRGARSTIRKHRPILYVENKAPAGSGALLEFIRSENYRLFWHIASCLNPSNFFDNPEQVIVPERVETATGDLKSIGVAINVIGIPAEWGVTLNELYEISDVREHPLKREYAARFNKAWQRQS